MERSDTRTTIHTERNNARTRQRERLHRYHLERRRSCSKLSSNCDRFLDFGCDAPGIIDDVMRLLSRCSKLGILRRDGFNRQTSSACKGESFTTTHVHERIERDTHASLLAASSVPLEVVRKRLGHSSIGVTAER